jgi:hypothetical protein
MRSAVGIPVVHGGEDVNVVSLGITMIAGERCRRLSDGLFRAIAANVKKALARLDGRRTLLLR